MTNITPLEPLSWPAIHYTIFYSNKQKHLNKLKTFLKNHQPPPLFQQKLIPLNSDKRIKEFYSPHLIILNSSIKRDPTPLCQHLNIKIIKHSIDKNYLDSHPQSIHIFYIKNNFFWNHSHEKTNDIVKEYQISNQQYTTNLFSLNISNSKRIYLNQYKNNHPTKFL